jgi:hypothetical protein
MSTLRDKIEAEIENFIYFRHYFSHAYMLDLEPQRMESLVKELPGVFEMLKAEASLIEQ